MSKCVFAIAAHPDDIEFMMGGTLALLGKAGCELHYLTLANGSCGAQEYDAATITKIRREEAMAAARALGAVYHESLVADMEIYFERDLLRRLASIVREVSPDIILTQAMFEYMEDHTNTTRLVLAAGFARTMSNFPVEPRRSAVQRPVTVYHALPYGLRDLFRRRVHPEIYVNISDVVELKRSLLAMHKSQREWLDVSQGLGSYLQMMDDMDSKVGQESGAFKSAEGWTRHLHFGYCPEDANPLVDTLGDRVLVSRTFERELER